MTTFSIFGIQQPIENVLSQVQDALGITFARHESSYRGVYYRYGVLGQEHFEIQPNYLELEAEWFREAYKDYPVLLLINDSTRPDEIDAALRKQIPSIQLLKQEEL